LSTPTPNLSTNSVIHCRQDEDTSLLMVGKIDSLVGLGVGVKGDQPQKNRGISPLFDSS